MIIDGQTRPYITAAEPLSSARPFGRQTEVLGMEPHPRMAPGSARHARPAELAEGSGPSPPRLRRRDGGAFRLGIGSWSRSLFARRRAGGKAHHQDGADRAGIALCRPFGLAMIARSPEYHGVSQGC